MRTNSVAVLDIRSSEITALVGERGVNNTFIIKSKYVCAYDGYAEGELLDVNSFKSAISDVVKSTLAATEGVKSFFVGVPGEFLKLKCTDKVISFKSAKKITRSDCEMLIDMSMPQQSEGWKIIRHSCPYFILSDKRKICDPVGAVSDSLQGKCSFYECNTAFIGCVKDVFAGFKAIGTVNFIPSNYAEAMYLLDEEIRSDCAVLFDFGYISSTYSVVCGNGLLFSESFSLGVGHLAYYLSSELDIPFPVASEFLTKVNLNAKERLTSEEEVVYEGRTYVFATSELRNLIREGLDGLCETIEECRQSFIGKNLNGKSLYVTGEHIRTVRGTVDHISGRLEKAVEVVAPKIPYYDKPQFSSVLSLLDTALKDSNK